MKVRVNNKKVLIAMLIILMLILAVGYAVFSEILTISGTANAKGTFDLEFQNAEIVKNIGADKEKTTAEISADKNILTVNVADLAYPGAGVEFSVDIVNVGTMPAEVHSVTPMNITGSDKIKVTGLDGIKVGHPKIEVGDRCNIHFTVEWPEDVPEILDTESSISFELQIEYVQATGEKFNGQPSHTDGDPIPEYTVPTGLTAVYGNTLADIELPEGFKFQDPLETPVGNAGTNSFKVTYTSEDNNEVTDIEVVMKVEKANPEYVLPTELTATYGNTLANVELPEGFKFQDPLETSVGNAGTNKFKVTYTPTDVNNYNIITDIEVSISVYTTLVNQITPEDYGKSVNYKATVNGKKVTNWKLLYKDENNTYLILDDYLPTSLVPSATKLSKSGTYAVYSSSSRDALLRGLTTESYWSEFANGVEGATAQGSPPFSIIMKSYNEKYSKSYNTDPTINNGGSFATTDKLYTPNQYGDVGAYWFADIFPHSVKTTTLWHVSSYGLTGGVSYNNTTLGIRPVVILPKNISGSIGDTIELK